MILGVCVYLWCVWGGGGRGGNLNAIGNIWSLDSLFFEGEGRNAFLMDKTEVFVVFNSKVISGKSILIFNRQVRKASGFQVKVWCLHFEKLLFYSSWNLIVCGSFLGKKKKRYFHSFFPVMALGDSWTNENWKLTVAMYLVMSDPITITGNFYLVLRWRNY